MIVKQATSFLIFLLTTFFCFGQNEYLEPIEGFKRSEHLEPAKNFNQYEGDCVKYYAKLYNGFSEKPYARYTSDPSFSANYAFSVEKNGEKNHIISNTFSKNFWQAGYNKKIEIVSKKWKSVKLRTSKTEINNDLYLVVGELFELLANQTKVYEKERFLGVDGTNYYFETTDKNGEIKRGTTWSPYYSPLLSRLVEICNKLYLIGIKENIDQTEIIKEISILINDFKTINKED